MEDENVGFGFGLLTYTFEMSLQSSGSTVGLCFIAYLTMSSSSFILKIILVGFIIQQCAQ